MTRDEFIKTYADAHQARYRLYRQIDERAAAEIYDQHPSKLLVHIKRIDRARFRRILNGDIDSLIQLCGRVGDDTSEEPGSSSERDRYD